MKKSQLKAVKSFAKKQYSALNWMHAQGMRKIAKVLAKKENANLEVVDIAVLFHDIGKKDLKKELYHHIEGAKIAKNFLKKLKIDNNVIDQVYHCILTHSTPLKYFQQMAKKAKKPKSFLPKPKTIEAKILFDIDMLQQLSPFGITKSLFFNYKIYDNDFIEGFEKTKFTLMRDAYKSLFTKTAKKIARERIIYLQKFFKWLENSD